jgi:hypothetical protein
MLAQSAVVYQTLVLMSAHARRVLRLASGRYEGVVDTFV